MFKKVYNKVLDIAKEHDKIIYNINHTIPNPKFEIFDTVHYCGKFEAIITLTKDTIIEWDKKEKCYTYTFEMPNSRYADKYGVIFNTIFIANENQLYIEEEKENAKMATKLTEQTLKELEQSAQVINTKIIELKESCSPKFAISLIE